MNRQPLPWRTKAQRDECFQQIFNLDLRNALEFYGVRFVGRSNFALCPFHAETDGSFSVKGNIWRCFGCNEGGGLVKFVAKRYNVNTTDAAVMICHDFKLGNFSNINPVKRSNEITAAEVKRRIAEKKRLDSEKAYLGALSEYLYSAYLLDNWKYLERAMCDIYGENPYSAELERAYIRNHRDRYNLELTEAERSEAYSRG